MHHSPVPPPDLRHGGQRLLWGVLGTELAFGVLPCSYTLVPVPSTHLRLRPYRRHAAEAVDRARVFDTLVNNLEARVRQFQAKKSVHSQWNQSLSGVV